MKKYFQCEHYTYIMDNGMLCPLSPEGVEAFDACLGGMWCNRCGPWEQDGGNING